LLQDSSILGYLFSEDVRAIRRHRGPGLPHATLDNPFPKRPNYGLVNFGHYRISPLR
jgi:hypothetical protein